MKNDNFSDRIRSTVDTAYQNDDAYYVVHFSAEEDSYVTLCGNLDVGSALVIIEDLVQKFGINDIALLSALR